MDVARAHPAQLKARRAGVLVAFFGDNSWGWFTPELLVDFVEHARDKAKQRTSLKVGRHIPIEEGGVHELHSCLSFTYIKYSRI